MGELRDRMVRDMMARNLAPRTMEAYVDQVAAMVRQDYREYTECCVCASTEKTSKVLGEQDTGGPPGEQGKQAGEAAKKKSKGHGRNPARAYDGARQVVVKHDTLSHGRRCAECERGNVYALPEPCALVRVTGMAPLSATVYNLERFRCGACGQIFTAKAPEGIGEKKYDESVASMIAMLKYGAGVPFYRLEKMQRSMGIPLPAATQWDLVRQAAVFHEAVC